MNLWKATTQDSGTISPEQFLWQAVLFKAFMDATYQPQPQYGNNARFANTPVAVGKRRAYNIEQRHAIAWIERGGSDFRMVCAMAGMDPDFLRDQFMAGKVDGVLLRAAMHDDKPLRHAAK